MRRTRCVAAFFLGCILAQSSAADPLVNFGDDFLVEGPVSTWGLGSSQHKFFKTVDEKKGRLGFVVKRGSSGMVEEGYFARGWAIDAVADFAIAIDARFDVPVEEGEYALVLGLDRATNGDLDTWVPAMEIAVGRTVDALFLELRVLDGDGATLSTQRVARTERRGGSILASFDRLTGTLGVSYDDGVEQVLIADVRDVVGTTLDPARLRVRLWLSGQGRLRKNISRNRAYFGALVFLDGEAIVYESQADRLAALDTDVNDDGMTDSRDIAQIIEAIDDEVNERTVRAFGDIDGDGFTDARDLGAALLAVGRNADDYEKFKKWKKEMKRVYANEVNPAFSSRHRDRINKTEVFLPSQKLQRFFDRTWLESVFWNRP